MKYMKGIKIMIRILIIFSLGAFLCLSLPQYAGLQCYIVISGSMRPALPVGSAVYVKKKSPDQIKKGEIITYTPLSEETRITHRVYETDAQNRCFITKGDANENVDLLPVQWENVCGVAVFSIPYIGYLLEFLDTWMGKIAMISWILSLYLCSEYMESLQNKKKEEVIV